MSAVAGVALGAAMRESLEVHAPHLLRGDGLRGRVLVHATAIQRTQAQPPSAS